MQIIGISYFTKIGALNSPPAQPGRLLCARSKARLYVKRGGLRQKGRAQPASTARRLAAVDCRPCRHYSAARWSAAVVQCGGSRQNSRAEPASRARRSAAVERRVGRHYSAAIAAEQSRPPRLQSEAERGSREARGPPQKRGGLRQNSGLLAAITVQRGGDVALGPLSTCSLPGRQALLRERRIAAVQRPTAPVESGGFRRQRARECASRAWRAAAKCGGLRQYSASPNCRKVARFQS